MSQRGNASSPRKPNIFKALTILYRNPLALIIQFSFFLRANIIHCDVVQCCFQGSAGRFSVILNNLKLLYLLSFQVGS